jgi:hypothetical protein
LASDKLTEVDAYPIETTKFVVEAVAPFASVTVTDNVDMPLTVGVPEMVPDEVLKLRPFTNVPVSEYANVVRPPVAGTEREKELSAVPDNPVMGVAIDNAPATDRVAVDEVVDAEEVDIPLLMEFVTTTV